MSSAKDSADFIVFVIIASLVVIFVAMFLYGVFVACTSRDEQGRPRQWGIVVQAREVGEVSTSPAAVAHAVVEMSPMSSSPEAVAVVIPEGGVSTSRSIDSHLLDRLNVLGYNRRNAERILMEANAFDVFEVDRAVQIISSSPGAL
jgi:hypothetical protein